MYRLTKPARKNPDAKPWKNGTGINFKYQAARLQVCTIIKEKVKQDLLSRRVGLPALRDSRPLKIQKASAGV